MQVGRGTEAAAVTIKNLEDIKHPSTPVYNPGFPAKRYTLRENAQLRPEKV